MEEPIFQRIQSVQKGKAMYLSVSLPLALFGPIGTPEFIFIVIVALLIFGRRLPDVARSVGRSIVEFKRGINEVNTDVERQSRSDSGRSVTPEAGPPGHTHDRAEQLPGTTQRGNQP